jgi:uncharacterized protein (DUF934 family)
MPENNIKINELLDVENWQKNNSTSSKGIILNPTDDVQALADTLNQASLIAVDFSNFDDGRNYSQIKLLKRIGYTGKIHAINVHIDHLQFILRSGVDSYELLPEYKKYDVNYASDFSICYQAADNNIGLLEKHKLD